MNKGRIAGILAVATAATAVAFGQSPVLIYHGIPLICVNDMSATQSAAAQEWARLAIDVVQSPVFRRRAEAALADPTSRRSRLDRRDVHALPAHDAVERVLMAAGRGFSIGGRMTSRLHPERSTNAWDGADEPACGRVIPVHLNYIPPRAKWLWAGTIVHELTHVAGFGHNSASRVPNQCSVPHLLGDIAEWTAWEIAHPTPRPNERFETFELACSAFARLCQSDPAGRCHVRPQDRPLR